jgi:hypothetical protein
MSLTNKQWAVIDWVRTQLISAAVGPDYAGRQEIKAFDVRVLEGRQPYAIVSIEFGSKTDEGTAAAIFCRQSFMWIVGPKGGCKRLDSKTQWVGHPGSTYFKAKTAADSKALRKLRAERKKEIQA